MQNSSVKGDQQGEGWGILTNKHEAVGVLQQNQKQKQKENESGQKTKGFVRAWAMNVGARIR